MVVFWLLIYLLALPFTLSWKLHGFLTSKLGQNSWHLYPVYLALFGIVVSWLFYRDQFWWNMAITAPACTVFHTALRREWSIGPPKPVAHAMSRVQAWWARL